MSIDPDRQRVQTPSPPGSYLLWCATCGMLATRSPADHFRFTREMWMECCGQVMCYFIGEVGEADYTPSLQPDF